MYTILNKIFVGDKQQAFAKILQTYQQQHFCIVDYLYFANIYGKKLFDRHDVFGSFAGFENALLDDYKKTNISLIHQLYQDAILDADLVLMDGIALQSFYFLAKKKWLPNLNGTDFAPYALESLVQRFGRDAVRVVLYGTHPNLLHKTKKFLQDQGYHVVYAQDGYTNLDRNQVEHSLPQDQGKINVLLVARSTPIYPIQEIWSRANIQQIKKYCLLVMNQGGTFDFRVGEQKRSPKIVRHLRLERLWRLILDPKRNYKKVVDSLGILHYIFLYLLLKKRPR